MEGCGACVVGGEKSRFGFSMCVPKRVRKGRTFQSHKGMISYEIEDMMTIDDGGELRCFETLFNLLNR